MRARAAALVIVPLTALTPAPGGGAKGAPPSFTLAIQLPTLYVCSVSDWCQYLQHDVLFSIHSGKPLVAVRAYLWTWSRGLGKAYSWKVPPSRAQACQRIVQVRSAEVKGAHPHIW